MAAGIVSKSSRVCPGHFGIGMHHKKAAFPRIGQNRVGGLGADTVYTEQSRAPLGKSSRTSFFDFPGNSPGLDEKILEPRFDVEITAWPYERRKSFRHHTVQPGRIQFTLEVCNGLCHIAPSRVQGKDRTPSPQRAYHRDHQC